MTERMQPNFKKGVTTLCILSLLQSREMYGYELVQATEELSRGQLKLQEGALYPVLYRLQEQGFVSDRKVLVGKRMTRVYYSLTQEGRQFLQEIRADYEQITRGVWSILEATNEKQAHETA